MYEFSRTDSNVENVTSDELNSTINGSSINASSVELQTSTEDDKARDLLASTDLHMADEWGKSVLQVLAIAHNVFTVFVCLTFFLADHPRLPRFLFLRKIFRNFLQDFF